MRPSLLRLTAAAGATAAVLAASPSARAAHAVFGGTAGSRDPIVVKADSKASELRSIIVSWRATRADGYGSDLGGRSAPCAPSEGFIRLPDHYRRHQLEGRHRLSLAAHPRSAQSRAKGARGQFGSRQAAPPRVACRRFVLV